MVCHYLDSHRRLGLYRAPVTHILAAALATAIPTTLTTVVAARVGNRCPKATSFIKNY